MKPVDHESSAEPNGTDARAMMDWALDDLDPADAPTEIVATTPAEAYSGSGGDQAGSVIGPFTLVRQIGQGGFGEVWEAEQHHPIRRAVALKLIKPGMASTDVLRRFDAERQALALMDHPNIARVFDAGTTPDGRPWFAMEMVDGDALTVYCDRRRFTIRHRLELFIKVCAAVQHAHQKAVLHRDLKPSNILVAEIDGQPVPKVIDFGIAKALEQPLTSGLGATLQGQLIGTPQYMSPEQIGMPEDVDTRSDVYSLGVILYELLTGQPPLDAQRLRKAALDEICRIIREEEPPKPSIRVAQMEAQMAQSTAERHGTDTRRWTHELNGELDWIVLKILDKDRSRRYESAAALAAELGRFLANEPVEAGPPTLGYRARKFVIRNKGGVLAATVVVLTLCGGLAAALWQRDIARQARQAAERDRDSKDQALKAATLANLSERRQREIADGARVAEQEQRKLADEARNETLRVNQTQKDLLEEVSRSDLSSAAKLAEDGQTSAALAYVRRALLLDASNAAAASFLTSLLCYSTVPLPPTPITVAKLRDGFSTPALSADGKLALVKGYQNAVICDAATGEQIGTPLTHSENIRAVRFDEAGRRVATASKDKTARLWDARTGKPESTPLMHPAPVSGVAFAPDGTRLLTVCDDQVVRLWDATSGVESSDSLRHEQPVTWAEFGPDTTTFITASGKDVTVISRWNLRAGRAQRSDLASLPIHQHLLTRTKDGRHLAIADSAGVVHVFNLAAADAKPTREFTIGTRPDQMMFHPSGNWLATAAGREVTVWDASTGSQRGKTITAAAAVTSLAFSTDGERVALIAGDLAMTAQMTIWQVSTGKAVTHPYPTGSVHRGSEALRFVDDDLCICVVGQDDVTKLRVTAGNTVPISTHMNSTSLLRAFSARQGWLAAADGQRLFFRSQVSDPDSESEAVFRAPIKALSASENGHYLGIQTGDQDIVVWHTLQKSAEAKLHAPGAVKCTAFSADGSRFACGGERDGKGWVCLWRLNQLSPLRRETANLGPQLEIAYPAPVTVVGLNADGRYVVAGLGSDKLRFLSALDTTGPRELGKMDFGAVTRSLTFSPAGTRVATINVAGSTVWDFVSNQGCWLRPPSSATTIVGSVAFNADGTRLYTAGYDAMVNEWDLSGPLQKDKLPAPKTLRHRTLVSRASLSRDGLWLFTAAKFRQDEENQVRLWHVPTHLQACPALPATFDGLHDFFSGGISWFGMTESDGGSWLLAGDRIWESFHGLPSGARLPAWLPDLISYAGGVQLGALGELQPIPAPDRIAARERLQAAADRTDGDDSWREFLQWFLVDPAQRTLSPHGRQRLKDAFIDAAHNRDAARLAELYRLDPRPGLAHLLQAGRGADPSHAAFLRELAVKSLVATDEPSKWRRLDERTALIAGELLLEQDDAKLAMVVASATGREDVVEPERVILALRAAALAKTGQRQKALEMLRRDLTSGSQRGEFLRLSLMGESRPLDDGVEDLLRELWPNAAAELAENWRERPAQLEARLAKLRFLSLPMLQYRGQGRWQSADLDVICLGSDLVDAQTGLLLAATRANAVPTLGDHIPPGGVQFFVPADAPDTLLLRTHVFGHWSPWRDSRATTTPASR